MWCSINFWENIKVGVGNFQYFLQKRKVYQTSGSQNIHRYTKVGFGNFQNFLSKRKASQSQSESKYSQLYQSRIWEFPVFPVKTQSVSESEYSPLYQSRILEFPVFPAKTQSVSESVRVKIFIIILKPDLGIPVFPVKPQSVSKSVRVRIFTVTPKSDLWISCKNAKRTRQPSWAYPTTNYTVIGSIKLFHPTANQTTILYSMFLRTGRAALSDFCYTIVRQ